MMHGVIAFLMCVGGIALVFGLGFYFSSRLCQHSWDLVDKTELPPPIEAYRNNGGTNLHWGYLGDHKIFQMCHRSIILALRCQKCGKASIKKIQG